MADLGGTSAYSNKDDSGGTMQSFDAATEAIEVAIKELHNQAMRVADRYYLHVNAHGARSTGPESKSKLELTYTIKGNSMEARWQAINWYGPKTNRTRIRKAIARDAKNFTYSEAALKSHAQPWEWPMVRLTETELKYIRRQLNHLIKAVTSMRHAKTLSKITEAKIAEAEKLYEEES